MEDNKMKKCVRAVLIAIAKTVKWSFIVFCVFLLTLFFCELPLPEKIVNDAIDKSVPTNLVVNIGYVGFGFRDGLNIRGIEVYDKTRKNPLEPLFEADSVLLNIPRRTVRVVGAKFVRLGDSYYEPGNIEHNERTELSLPDLKKYRVILEKPDILAVKADIVEADVSIVSNRMDAVVHRLDWPDKDRQMSIAGYCCVDLENQVVHGEVEGTARQANIRPMLEAIDIPVALPYMDAFTEVTEPVPAICKWNVNLINCDFNLFLDLKPKLGRYNNVAMDRAHGVIEIATQTRGTNFNYKTMINVLAAKDIKGHDLAGKVTITGTNGYCVVDIGAKSNMPLADLLKIGGFEEDYLGSEIQGDTQGVLQFCFPRSMTNNYEVMRGFGNISMKDGQIMRMRGFTGLIDLLAEKVPGVSYVTDRTHAKFEYEMDKGEITIKEGVVDGGLFALNLSGSYNMIEDKLDNTAQVRFLKNDSLMSKLVTPVTWVFSKLLLEYRLTGSSANPKWEYVSVIDRVKDIVK
jgi:hypothetical protein